MRVFYIIVTKLLTNTSFVLTIRAMKTKTIFRNILLKNKTHKLLKIRVSAVIFRKFFLKYLGSTLLFSEGENLIKTAFHPF